MSVGKVAIITGGARGIGYAEAAEFANNGYRVIVADVDAAAAVAAADRLGRGASADSIDVRDPASVATFFRRVSDTHGRLDVLVNNAGLTSFDATEELSEERWDMVVDLHLGGAFRCAKEAYPLLARSGGAIVNTSSISATYVSGKHAAYSAAKGGIIALTRDLAVEWAPRAIRVNAVAPGRVDTPMLRDLVAKGIRNAETLTRRIPMGRLARPEDIAEVVFFLGDKAGYVTGQTIVVDGGFSIWNTGE